MECFLGGQVRDEQLAISLLKVSQQVYWIKLSDGWIPRSYQVWSLVAGKVQSHVSCWTLGGTLQGCYRFEFASLRAHFPISVVLVDW